jgi:hypothetical protein
MTGTFDTDMKDDIDNGDEYVTRNQAMQIGKRAAIATTHEIFQLLGHDLSSPESVIQIQVDSAWTRRQRVAGETMSKQIKKTAIGAVILGIMTAVWLGVQELIHLKTGA